MIGSLGWTLFFYLFFFFFFFLALMRPPESSTMRCAHQLTCSISIISHSPTLRAVRSAYHHLLLPVFLLLLYLCVCVCVACLLFCSQCGRAIFAFTAGANNAHLHVLHSLPSNIYTISNNNNEKERETIYSRNKRF